MAAVRHHRHHNHHHTSTSLSSFDVVSVPLERIEEEQDDIVPFDENDNYDADEKRNESPSNALFSNGYFYGDSNNDNNEVNQNQNNTTSRVDTWLTELREERESAPFDEYRNNVVEKGMIKETWDVDEDGEIQNFMFDSDFGEPTTPSPVRRNRKNNNGGRRRKVKYRIDNDDDDLSMVDTTISTINGSGSFDDDYIDYSDYSPSSRNSNNNDDSGEDFYNNVCTLNEDDRLLELAIYATRAKHEVCDMIFDESEYHGGGGGTMISNINIVKDFKFVVVRLSLPMGIQFHENDGGLYVKQIIPPTKTKKNKSSFSSSSSSSSLHVADVEIGDQLAAIHEDDMSAIGMTLDEMYDCVKYIKENNNNNNNDNNNEIILTFLRYIGPMKPSIDADYYNNTSSSSSSQRTSTIKVLKENYEEPTRTSNNKHHHHDSSFSSSSVTSASDDSSSSSEEGENDDGNQEEEHYDNNSLKRRNNRKKKLQLLSLLFTKKKRSSSSSSSSGNNNNNNNKRLPKLIKTMSRKASFVVTNKRKNNSNSNNDKYQLEEEEEEI